MNKKIFMASVASLLLMGVPAFAAGNASSQDAAPAHAQKPNSNSARNDALQAVKDATTTLHQAKNDHDFDKLLHQAKGIFIVPHYGKGALIVGGSEGHGVLLARENGHWSDPAFMALGSVSVGAQAGGEGGSIIMVLMTDKALSDFTEHSNFSLNANAGLSIVNYSARAEGGFGKGDVVLWSNTSGAFGGAAITGSDISADQDRDNAFYDRQNLTTNTIIKQNIKSAAAAPLVEALSG
ncbi:MAG TPA: lipid-binding SYLF domain-containing protein [Stellaceae bacterium]|nr:lipid-binding SYLF domain-containing protein [Stellaceae bacterium]